MALPGLRLFATMSVWSFRATGSSGLGSLGAPHAGLGGGHEERFVGSKPWDPELCFAFSARVGLGDFCGRFPRSCYEDLPA